MFGVVLPTRSRTVSNTLWYICESASDATASASLASSPPLRIRAAISENAVSRNDTGSRSSVKPGAQMLCLHECMREVDHGFRNFSLRHITSNETELSQRFGKRGCAPVENTLVRIGIDAQRQRPIGCSDLLEGANRFDSCRPAISSPLKSSHLKIPRTL